MTTAEARIDTQESQLVQVIDRILRKALGRSLTVDEEYRLDELYIQLDRVRGI